MLSDSMSPTVISAGRMVLFLSTLYACPWLGAAALAVFIAFGKRYVQIYYAILNIPRDLHIIWRAGKTIIFSYYCARTNVNVVRRFQKWVKKSPKQIALMTKDMRWTFEELDDYSDQVGRYFCRKVSRGETVALIADGSPRYVGIWLGLAKVGVVTALVNFNQRKEVLQHSLDSVKANVIIYGTEYAQAVAELDDSRLAGYKLYSLGEDDTLKDSTNLEAELQTVSKDSLEEYIDRIQFNDKLLYIYTSGTTGLPKAAVISHARFMLMGLGSHMSVATSQRDTMYTSLPLYHSAGGVLGTATALVAGATVFIRPKFSVSNFWKDCIQYKCTMAQYIGETCRFLLNTPHKPEETQHRIRLMIGNGLRPQIWKEFVQRFKVPWIVEFYGATEGNANLVNLWNRIGAVGYVPWFAKQFYPCALIKVTEDTKEPIRDENGLCIFAEQGEPGLLVGKIRKTHVMSDFIGYADKSATEKKILHNVFSHGDSAFNTGDVLLSDELGYYYFKDRTGDTFRWKGENVSTSEVEAIISKIIGLQDCTVYGVEVPEMEGKAGMAALVDEGSCLNFSVLEIGVKNLLSSYARPIFLRVLHKLPMTSTFKLQKTELQKQGFNPKEISDPLFYLDCKSGKYLPLTEEVYNDIAQGGIKL